MEKIKINKGECKICDDETKFVVNIKLQAVPLCASCCNTIMLQQAIWLAEEDYKRRTK